MSDSEREFEQQKLELERQKHVDATALARERLEYERRQAGKFSGTQVTLITLFLSGLTGLATAGISGLFDIKSTRTASQGQIDLKLTEVEGQLEVQRLIAEAERGRLNAQQNFEIIVQATKGLPAEIAASNLMFFVEAGILPDSEGRIRKLALQGNAPQLPQSSERLINPLLSRMENSGTGSRGGDERQDLRVENGILYGSPAVPVAHVPSPNLSEGNNPKYIIVDYSAYVGGNFASWLSNAASSASVHIVIARDGSVTQFVPLDYVAWHAGRSSWGVMGGLNRHSIGIQLENAGRLTQNPDGQWRTWYNKAIPDEEVLVARHKFSDEEAGWHVYSQAQILTLRQVVTAIVTHQPKIIDIIGQDDISPKMKEGPGPALPLEDIREATFQRRLALDPPI